LKNQRRIYINIFNTVALLWVTVFFSCSNDIEKVNALLNADTDYPQQSADSIEILYSDSGIVRLKLEAPKLYKYDDVKEPYAEFPVGLHVSFYDDTLGIESEITAGYAIWKTSVDIWEARDNVIATNTVKGYTLNTELLIWDKQKELLFSPKFVRVTTKEEVIWGDGFEANQNFTWYHIKQIKGRINLDDE